MKIFLKLGLILFLTSCGFHHGTMVSNASLGDNNFEIIDIVSASSQSKKYFGIGGLNQKALVFDTKRKLYNNYPLKRNQAFANLSVDFHNTYILFVNKVTCIISADVVQFGTTQSDSLHKLFGNLQDKENVRRLLVDGEYLDFSIGQTVYFKSGSTVGKGKIKSIAAQLNLIQVVANEQSFNLNPSFIFYQIEDKNLPKSLQVYDSEKEVQFKVDDVKKYGNIVGTNRKFVVLKSEDELYIRTPSEIEF